MFVSAANLPDVLKFGPSSLSPGTGGGDLCLLTGLLLLLDFLGGERSRSESRVPLPACALKYRVSHFHIREARACYVKMNKRKFGAGRGFSVRGKGPVSRSPPEKRSRRDNIGNSSQGNILGCIK